MLGLNSYLISSNGAKIHDKDNNEIYRNNIPSYLSREIFDININKKFHKSVFKDDYWYVESQLPEFDDFHKESGFKSTIINFEDIKNTEITKFLFLGDEPKDFVDLEKYMRNKFGNKLNLARSNEVCLEVMNENVSKGNAVKYVLDSLNIDIKNVVSFGDGWNDIDMLSISGLSFLMKNASDGLKEKLSAHEVIDTNRNDGVAKKLKEIFL
jgi:Cof subfamily protein (haloacid dehalogenase superfamily)